MKIQSLAIMFIIIMLPISFVFSEYLSNQIQTRQNIEKYDKKLLNSTYDAIKAYQLNTINNAFGDVTNKKIEDIEAAANTFFNSLTAGFNFSGYNSDVMKEYVPGIVFTMYDGYYMYSPFQNTLTGMKSDDYDHNYSNDTSLQVGLKPYVYYNCRYTRSNDDFVITYTLDNYITIQGIINGDYHYDYGYLYNIADNKSTADSFGGIYKEGDRYYYGGCYFSSSDTEELKEFVGEKEYSYAKINGKKYYLEPGSSTNYVNIGNGVTINANDRIFFIDEDGTKNYNQVSKGYNVNSSNPNSIDENKTFLQYYFAIKKNKSAYEYFKSAYEFSCAVFGKIPVGETYYDKGQSEVKNRGYNIGNLRSSDAWIYNHTTDISKDIIPLKEYGDINIFGGSIPIEKASSNFEQHRKAIIRYVIETNLSTAIASFSSSANNGKEFIMPKISDIDWELIQNDVCAVSFLQGLSVGNRKYNGYSVVANTLTKEYIDENDIYVLAKDQNGRNIYCKVNDDKLDKTNGYTIQGNTVGYYPGIWKINFELKQDPGETADKTIIYCPMSYAKNKPYQASYTSVIGDSSNDIENATYPDMYTYVNQKASSTLKKAYYIGLARERYGAFNINNINYEIYKGNDNQYFLERYNVDSYKLKP